MLMKHGLSILFLVCSFLAVSLLAAEDMPPNAIDLSDKLMKYEKFLPLGPKEFGVHDTGEKAFKIFDWQFNIKKSIPIIKGEGPAELKSKVSGACITPDGSLFLNGSYEYTINKYDATGKYLTSFKTAFFALDMLQHQGKLYIFSSGMEMSTNDSPFLQVMDSTTGKTLKMSKFQTIPDKDTPLLNYLPSHYNVAIEQDGTINIICGATPALFKVTEDGKILQKIRLPFKDERKITKTDYGQNVQWRKLYQGMTIINGIVYAHFEEYNYKDIPKSKNFLISIDQNGQVKKLQTIIGFYEFIGGNSGSLFLFQRDDYFALPIKLNDKGK